MAEPRESAPPPTTSYADDRRTPAPTASAPSDSDGFAAWYASRFGTPMPTPRPTSYADERRAPVPTPTYTPQQPASPAAMYQARWGTPRPVSSADDRRQPNPLVEILKGLSAVSPDRIDPARTRGEERRKKPLPPETFSDNYRKGPNSPAGDDRRGANARAPRGTRSADERRQAPVLPPSTFADDRRPGPLPPSTHADDRRKGPNSLEGMDARAAQNFLAQLVTAASPDSIDRPFDYKYGDERRFPMQPSISYADDLRGANARKPRGTRSADERRTGARQYSDDRRSGLRSRVFADENREPGMLPPPPEPEKPPKMAKGMKLENIPAPPSRLSGKRRGEGDTAKRGPRTEAVPYDPAQLRTALEVLAEAQTPAIDIKNWTTEGGVTSPNIDFNHVPEWLRTGDLLPGINIDVERGTMEDYIPGVHFTQGDTSKDPNARMSVEEAQAIVDTATRARRAHAIGSDRAAASNVPISDRVDRMTWEEYDALDPKQRAAVDFNAGLVTAVRRDRKSDYGEKDEGAKKEYDALVKKIFGKDGGSDTYAPATVALLESIGFTDKNADLDDFLNLSAAVKEGDLKFLDQTGVVAPEAADTALGMFGVPTTDQGEKLSGTRKERVGLSQDLALRTASNIDEVMQRGNGVLQTFAQSAAVDRNDLVTKLGGEAVAPAAVTGYGTPTDEAGDLTLDGYIVKLYNSLANKANNPDDVMATLQGDIAKGIMTPEKMKAFYDFAEHRTRQALQYNMPTGDSSDITYRDPNELRVFLNMEKVNSSG